MTDYASLYKPIAVNSAINNGLNPDVFSRLVESESSWNPKAYNPNTPGGAHGIAQFTVGTAKDYGVNNPYDPSEAIPAAAKLLSDRIAKYGGNVAMGVASYKGYKDLVVGSSAPDVMKVLGYDVKAQSETDAKNAAMAMGPFMPGEGGTESFPVSEESIWKWKGDDWSNFFKNKALGLSFFLFGLLLIVFSIYAIIVRGKSGAAQVVSKFVKG